MPRTPKAYPDLLQVGVEEMLARIECVVAASQQRIARTEKIVSYSRRVVELCREEGALARRITSAKEPLHESPRS
jgi:hypothetical protein